MFSKYKRRLKSKTAALFAAAILLCGLTGCDGGETSSAVHNSSASAAQSTAAESSKEIQSAAVSSDNAGSSDAQSEQSVVKTEFDFDKAVKNISLFGHKISLPCRWSDFGEDFSHDETYYPSGNDVMCGLLYKGKKIGDVFFANCSGKDGTAEIEKKPIICIIFGFTNYGPPYADNRQKYLENLGYYTDLLELSVGNISMSSVKNDIIKELGEPSLIGGNTSGNHRLTYNYENGYLAFYISGDANYKGGINELYVCVNSD